MVQPFYSAVYGVVDDPTTDSIISWSKSNKSFVIWDRKEFVRKNLLGIYCCGQLRTMRGFLRIYGFERIRGSGHLEFGHSKYFVKGHPELLDKFQDEVRSTPWVSLREKRAQKKAQEEAADCLQGLQI